MVRVGRGPVGRELGIGRGDLDPWGRGSVGHMAICPNKIKVTTINPKITFSRILNISGDGIYILNETLFDAFEVFLEPSASVEGNWTSLDMAASSANIASMFPTSLFSPGAINPPV